MALFKKKEVVRTNHDVLTEYMEKCLETGNTIESAVKALRESGNYSDEDIDLAAKFIEEKDERERERKLDADVEKKIKKHPKKIQKHLRMLYQDYKKGNLIFPEGFDKEKFLKNR